MLFNAPFYAQLLLLCASRQAFAAPASTDGESLALVVSQTHSSPETIMQSATAISTATSAASKPTAPPGPTGGLLFSFPGPDCKQTRARPFKVLPVDKCMNLEDSIQMKSPAFCANGTQALWAVFKGKNCDTTSRPVADGLRELDDSYMGSCTETTDLKSMAFWCHGLPGVDLAGPPKGAGHALAIALGVTLGFMAMFFGLAVWFKLDRGLGDRLKMLFRRSGGGIAL